MMTLIKKELRSLFFSPIYLVVITLITAAPSIVLTIYLNAGEKNPNLYVGFENVVSVMAILFAIAVPIVVASMISREYRNGTAGFLNSMPISKFEIVISKFAAASIAFLIPCGIMAFFPSILSQFGMVNFANCFLALALLVLFLLFTVAFSLMLSALTKRTGVAIAVSYVVFVLSFFMGVFAPLVRFLPFGTKFDIIAQGFLEELSVFKKLDRIAFEIFDWSAVIFFAVATILFIIVTVVAYCRDAKYSVALNDGKRSDRLSDSKKAKKDNREGFKYTIGAKKKAIVAVCALFVACMGVVPAFLPYNVKYSDVTSVKLYTVNDSNKKYLSQNKEPITVYLIDPYGNDEMLYNVILRTVDAAENVTLEIVNSSESADFLKEYGLSELHSELLSYSMIVKSEKRWRFLSRENYFIYYNEKMGYLTTEELQYRYTYVLQYLNRYYESYDKLSVDMQKFLDNCLAIYQSINTETATCIQIGDVFSEAIAYVCAENIPTVYSISGHGEKGNISNGYDIAKEGKIPEDADILMINSPDKDYGEEEISLIREYLEKDGKLYILVDKNINDMPNLCSLLSDYGLSVATESILKEESGIVDVSLNKEHKAFEALTAAEVTVKDVSEIFTDSQKTEYKYTPMLTYKSKITEGDAELDKEQVVALSVSEDGKEKITLFTGAVTFNDSKNGIEEEALERTSLCLSSTLSWLFEPFDSGLEGTAPKLFEKGRYIAEDGDIAKIILIFSVLMPMVVGLCGINIFIRRQKSKRAVISGGE